MNHQALHRIGLVAAVLFLSSCEAIYELQAKQIERQTNLVRRLYPNMYTGWSAVARTNMVAAATGGTSYAAYKEPRSTPRSEPDPQPKTQTQPVAQQKKDAWR